MINTPPQIAIAFGKFGIAKSMMSAPKLAVLAILGGVFISFGGLLTLMVAGGMPTTLAVNPGLIKLISGALFPIGLILVTIAGGDLFTSDCTAMTLPYLQRQITISALLKVWLISYFFNFIGAQFIAYTMSTNLGMFAMNPWNEYLEKLATAKVNMDFSTVFVKGIGANWLVCLGAWMGFAAKDVTGKVIGIWIPVMLFVALGYEHSIANMFFIPAAIYNGAPILWSDFIVRNLIPATLGNIIGGAGLVACVYWYVYAKDDSL